MSSTETTTTKKSSAFLTREKAHTTPPSLLSGPKLLAAGLQILFGPAIRWLLVADIGSRLVELFGGSGSPVEGDRLELFSLVCALYGLRWAVGFFTLNGGGKLSYHEVLAITVFHFILLVIPIVILPTMNGGLPPTLNVMDYTGLALSILAGVLQQGSEFQRLLFKRDPHNKGKLHTTGLFGYARYMNHTGHILQDVAIGLMTQSWIWAVWTVVSAYGLVNFAATDMDQHLKTKYGAQFEKYQQKTPYKFVPLVY